MTQIDPIIHPPKRLRIMAALCAIEQVSFAYLRDRMDLRDADLSKQAKALAEAGYIAVTKQGRGPGAQTWFAATDDGRQAYAAHIEALRDVIGT